MTEPEGHSSERLPAQANQITAAVDGRRRTGPMRASDACFRVRNAVRLSLQAFDHAN